MDTVDEIEKIKRAIRSSHAVMFNMKVFELTLAFFNQMFTTLLTDRFDVKPWPI